MQTSGSIDAPGSVGAGGVAVPSGGSSYPGGKSGAGIYQRLINLIPRHRILITAFAGQCGVTRNITAAAHTIVIDADETVCQWWDSWRRTSSGRDIEIHHCDSIEWLRFRFGLTEYSASGSSDARASDEGLAVGECDGRDAAGSRESSATADVADLSGSRPTPFVATTDPEVFVFCDPPYVLSRRSHGKQYACELSDDDHRRLLRILTAIPAARARIMLCGYTSPIYATCDRDWQSIDHRVPTRGGLQDERIWMNYEQPDSLHDHRYVGDCHRSRERIRRRQRNWLSQLAAMPPRERAAMLEALQNGG